MLPGALPPTLPPNYPVLGGKPRDRVGRPSEKAQSDRAFTTELGTAQDLSSGFVNRWSGVQVPHPAPPSPRGKNHIGTAVQRFNFARGSIHLHLSERLLFCVNLPLRRSPDRTWHVGKSSDCGAHQRSSSGTSLRPTRRLRSKVRSSNSRSVRLTGRGCWSGEHDAAPQGEDGPFPLHRQLLPQPVCRGAVQSSCPTG